MHKSILKNLKFTIVLAALLLALPLAQIQAQDIFGTINGTVTDASGAVVPDAKVTVTQEESKLSRQLTTDDKGYFVAAQLAVGPYTVTAQKDRFKTEEKTGNVLVAGGHLTVNLKLQVGASTETIEVHSTGVEVNTTSSEISTTIDSKTVVNAALNERNYVQLVTLVPGAALTSFDQTAFTTGQSIAPANINGLRTDANLVSVDGGFNLDSGSNGTQFNNVGLDFIQEVNLQTSNYSAEYGRSAASTINVVTKSGGNQFHGTLFEFVRNDDFDAKPALAPKSELRFNDFGGDIGGPIVKGKLFFFGGVEFKRLVLPGDGLSKTLTLPTSPELIGNFADSGQTLTAKGVVSANCIGNYSGGPTDTNPANFVVSATGKGTALAPACITGGGQAISNIYKLISTPGATPESASSFSNLATANNATFSPVTPQNWEEDVVRIDYVSRANRTEYFRYIHDHLILIDPFGPFSPGGALPTSPQDRNRPGFSYQFGDIWTATPNVVNEIRFNVSWNKQRIPPTGTLWQQATYGFNSKNFVLPFPGVGPFPTGIPSGTFTGTCPTTACPAEFLGPYEFLLAPTTDISPSDNLTWQVKSHTIKVGASYARNRKDQNSRTDATQGQLNFNSASVNTTGDQFADALLGNYNSLTQFSDDPVGHYRFNTYGAYAQDNWKVTRNLNVEFGVRWELTSPTYTQGNNLVNFDPSLYTTIPGLTISAGNVPTVPLTSGNVLDCPQTSPTPGLCNSGGFVVSGLVRSGNVPADEAARTPSGYTPFVQAVPVTGNRGFFKEKNNFGPRVGFAYSPFGPKTVIRAGFGLYYDKPEGNLVFGQTGLVPYLQQISFLSGNLGALPTSGSAPTVGSLSAVAPNLRVAEVAQYSLSVQHELPYGVLVQAAYAGNHAWHELREPNIDVPSFAQAIAAPAGTTINQVRPFLGYTDISQFVGDGTSNYNALQLSATKTRGIVTLQVSYTYSHTLGAGSGLNDNFEPFCAFSCVTPAGQAITWKQYDYGSFTYDIRNIFVAAYTLADPFFKNDRGYKGYVLGGWQLSGIVRAQSGQPLTVTGSTTLAKLSGESFTNRANLVSGVPLNNGVSTGVAGCTVGAAVGAKNCDFNTAAFNSTGITTALGTAPVGNIIGPGYNSWDFSLRKYFPLPKESMTFLIQLDAFNAFNRVNYQNPNVTVTSSAFGTITATQPPRQLQLGAKFTF